MDLTPLHDGPHDSVSDITASDVVFVGLIVLALAALGVLIWYVVKRRSQGPGEP